MSHSTQEEYKNKLLGINIPEYHAEKLSATRYSDNAESKLLIKDVRLVMHGLRTVKFKHKVDARKMNETVQLILNESINEVDNIKEAIRHILSNLFDIDMNAVNDDATLNCLNVDAVELIAAFKQEYNIIMHPSEIADLKYCTLNYISGILCDKLDSQRKC